MDEVPDSLVTLWADVVAGTWELASDPWMKFPISFSTIFSNKMERLHCAWFTSIWNCICSQMWILSPSDLLECTELTQACNLWFGTFSVSPVEGFRTAEHTCLLYSENFSGWPLSCFCGYHLLNPSDLAPFHVLASSSPSVLFCSHHLIHSLSLSTSSFFFSRLDFPGENLIFGINYIWEFNANATLIFKQDYVNCE